MLTSLPRWAVLLMNVAVLVGLYVVAELAKLVGWQVCLGFIIGFLLCYITYSCWRVDDKWEGYQRFPPEERQKRYERDKAIDPRL